MDKRNLLLLGLVATMAACTAETADKSPDADPVGDTESVVATGGSADSGTAISLLGHIASGDTVTGSFDPRARYVAWTFDAGAGDGVNIVTSEAGDRWLDTVLFVYGAEDGHPVRPLYAWDDDSGDRFFSAVSFEAPEARRYMAIVRRYDFRPWGSFALTLTIESATRICGVRGAPAECPEGQYCHWEPADMCGAADAPGECQPVPTACPRIYHPVCGCDGVDYGNWCLANVAGTSVAHDGRCDGACGGIAGFMCPSGQFCDYGSHCGAGDQQGTCAGIPTVCTREFAPVCGCDGSTYSNACNAHAAGVAVAHDGACEEPPGECGGATCAAGEYCAVTTCGDLSTGSCAPQPELCTALYDPVCGCDGTTYSNACRAASAGVSVAFPGECPASPDCRTEGCHEGDYCSYCWGSYACIPEGAVC